MLGFVRGKKNRWKSHLSERAEQLVGTSPSCCPSETIPNVAHTVIGRLIGGGGRGGEERGDRHEEAERRQPAAGGVITNPIQSASFQKLPCRFKAYKRRILGWLLPSFPPSHSSLPSFRCRPALPPSPPSTTFFFSLALSLGGAHWRRPGSPQMRGPRLP